MMMLEKVKMTKRNLKIAAPRRDFGFTAVEIAMVGAVIAILSLIVLPIFRNRVEDAKIAAAQADLRALMLAEQVVKADTDAYARLEDLDNVELFGYTTAPPQGVDKEVPFFRYVSPIAGGTPAATRRLMLNDAERVLFAGTEDLPKWRGPYIAFQRSITYEDLRNAGVSPLASLILRSNGGNESSPVQDFNGGTFFDSDDNRYPVDPWGSPYLFFPPNGNAADPTDTTGEYASSIIYSMGPNGQPGDGSAAANRAAYTREYAAQLPAGDFSGLGKDDDLMVEF